MFPTPKYAALARLALNQSSTVPAADVTLWRNLQRADGVHNRQLPERYGVKVRNKETSNGRPPD